MSQKVKAFFYASDKTFFLLMHLKTQGVNYLVKRLAAPLPYPVAAGIRRPTFAAPAPGAAGYLGQPATVFTTILSLDRSLSGDQGNLRVALTKAYIDIKVKDLKLDVLTIIVTSSFLTVEVKLTSGIFHCSATGTAIGLNV